MTTFCHIGMGRLGIAVANAMMLLQKGNTHAFFEPLPEARQKLHDGEFAEMLMVAAATNNEATWHESIPLDADAYIITAGVPRKSSTQPKSELLAANYSIVTQLVNEIPEFGKVFVATNPPKELAAELLLDGIIVTPLRDCTDNLRRQVWGSEWTIRNNAMLDAKGYTTYGPAVAIALEVLLCLEQPAR